MSQQIRSNSTSSSLVPQSPTEGSTLALDPTAILRLTRQSFAYRVEGESMPGLDLKKGDILIGDFTPEVTAGRIVMALVDGESVLRRVVKDRGQLCLESGRPEGAARCRLSDLVIQGTVHTLVRRLS